MSEVVVIILRELRENDVKMSGMAVDWVADNLYWAAEDRGYIVMSRLDGRYANVLVSGLTRPRAVAVNPLTGCVHCSSLLDIVILSFTRGRCV